MDKIQTSPLVSIVLSTYNGELFLEEQLTSLFNQTYSRIEIIATDDASSDKTADILKKFADLHSNMHVYINESNLGFIKNFDRGCSLSKGEFIALCDQDDCWHADKITKMVAAIGDSSLIYCDSFICNEKLQKTGKRISDIVNCLTFTSCLQQTVFCRIYGHATLFTRELYNRSHPFIQIIPHDWWLSFMATLAGSISYFPEPLVYYRQHSNNLFGAVGVKRQTENRMVQSKARQLEKVKIRTRVSAFYNACPNEMQKEKKVLLALKKSYATFSLANNFRRVALFLRYRNVFLSVKKHTPLHRLLFCFKMFAKIK